MKESMASVGVRAPPEQYTQRPRAKSRWPDEVRGSPAPVPSSYRRHRSADLPACPVHFGLLHPLVERMGRTADLGTVRRNGSSSRRMFGFMFPAIRTARARTSDKNLFVVLLVIEPTSHELGSPVNPVQFTIVRPRCTGRRGRQKKYFRALQILNLMSDCHKKLAV